MTTRKNFTITLDSHLVREAKKRAIDLEVPLYKFVEDSLREALAAGARTSPISQKTKAARTSEQDMIGRQS